MAKAGGIAFGLIMSHDVFDQRAGFPLTLALTSKSVPKRSWVKISQVRTLAVERIGRRLGGATAAEVTQVIEGLIEIMGGN